MPNLGKITLTFRTKGVAYHTVAGRLDDIMVDATLEAYSGNHPIGSDFETRMRPLYEERIVSVLNKFFPYLEYVRVEIDLDAGTAKVIETQ
jgi:hypothetical protein